FFPRNDDEPFFTRGRFLIALGFYLFGGLAFKIGANPPTPSTMGIISSLITVVLALAYLLRRVSRGLNKQVANSSLLMDVLSITTVIVFISLALSIQSVVLYDYHSISGFALDVIVKFTATTAVIMLIYRFVFKRRIAV
ncbi:hypothetical protein KC614_04415, partial [candidate division WWE3 bacterium]|nr:hypothetical protein [candidate division WWE3 bacterium]